MSAQPSRPRASGDDLAIEALVAGRDADPFAVLGPHDSGAGRVVRALMPGAVAVAAVDRNEGSTLGQLHKVDPGGLFAGTVPGSQPYRLLVHWPDRVEELDDPYSFGPLLGDLDLHLIAEGTHRQLGAVLGAHAVTIDGISGVRFAVWAPNAQRVSVVGDFNGWDGRRHVMRLRHSAGVWEIFLPNARPGQR